MYPCSAHIVTLVPHRSPLLLLLCPYIIIFMSALIMLWPLRLLYIERRYFHLYHPRIVHLCNVKEVAPSKRLNSKALIYLFYLFLRWLSSISNCVIYILTLTTMRPTTICPISSILLLIADTTWSLSLHNLRNSKVLLHLHLLVSHMTAWFCHYLPYHSLFIPLIFSV